MAPNDREIFEYDGITLMWDAFLRSGLWLVQFTVHQSDGKSYLAWEIADDEEQVEFRQAFADGLMVKRQ